MLKCILFPIHADGWRFVIPAAIATFFLFQFHISLGCIGLVLTIWCYYFFRNPKRMVLQNPHLILSPADGVVDSVLIDTPPHELGLNPTEKWWRISIFLNVFDVHVNRIPLEGTVQKILYHPGKFLNASLDKASHVNERNSLVITNKKHDVTYACVQIAGLIARRIRCDVKEQAQVESGEYFGLIRFGSRVDVYLPQTVVPQVLKGQMAVGGETILADVRTKGTPVEGKWL